MNEKNQTISENLLKKFSEYLTENLGFYYPSERWDNLKNKIHDISLELKKENISECLKWFLEMPLTEEKINLLSDHFTVGETYFFRDAFCFEILKKEIIPDLINRHMQTDH